MQKTKLYKLEKKQLDDELNDGYVKGRITRTEWRKARSIVKKMFTKRKR
jgi:hypothetical protein